MKKLCVLLALALTLTLVLPCALAEEEKVQIVGFGAFETKVRAERMGRNPKTGEDIPIPATKVPTFKAGKALKDAVDQ